MEEIKIKNLPKSRIEITGEIPAEIFMSYREVALKEIQKTFTKEGFRTGNVPIDMIEKNIKEMSLLEEMAERAIALAYPKIIVEHKLDVVSRPEVGITKLAKGNPLGFIITTDILPKIEKLDYVSIAKKSEENQKPKEEIAVSDEEMNNVLLDLRRSRVAHPEGHDSSAPHDHSHPEIKEEDLPPMDEKFFASLGNFKTANELKVKIKENLTAEKTRAQLEKSRASLMDSLIDAMEIEMPESLIVNELERMFARLKADIEATGVTFDEYLKYTKKTEGDLKKDWRPDAEKRAKLELLFHHIATAEKLAPKEEVIEHEVAHMLEHYKDIDHTQARAYITHVFTNEEVFKFLEKSN